MPFHPTQSKCQSPLTSYLWDHFPSYQPLAHSTTLHWPCCCSYTSTLLYSPGSRNCPCSNLCLEFSSPRYFPTSFSRESLLSHHCFGKPSWQFCLKLQHILLAFSVSFTASFSHNIFLLIYYTIYWSHVLSLITHQNVSLLRAGIVDSITQRFIANSWKVFNI